MRVIVFLVSIVFVFKSNAQWLPFGTGSTNGTVIEFEHHDDTLFACGLFNTIDGTAANGAAKRAGSGWVPIGLPQNAGIHSIRSLNGQLYVTPYKDALDSNYLFRIVGQNAWQALGKGFYLTNASTAAFRFCSLYDVILHNGDIYVSGEFDRVGADTIHGIARWDGLKWQGLGKGLTGNIANTASQIYPHKMLSTPNGLIVAGNFLQAGDSTVNGIALWDGSNWHPFGDGFNSTVYSLELYQGEIFAGGDFTASGSNNFRRIAKWNGSTWVNAGFEVENTTPNGYCFIHTLKGFGDTLIFAGDFNEVITNGGTITTSNVAGFKNSAVIGMPSGPNSTVEAMTKHQGDLVFGGYFTQLGGQSSQARMATYNFSISIQENETLGEVVVFPNPTANKVTLQNCEQITKIEVYDSNGLQIYESSEHTNELDFSNFPSGVYMLMIQVNGSRQQVLKVEKW